MFSSKCFILAVVLSAFVLVLNAKPYKRQAVSPVPANSTSGLEEHPTGSLGTPMDEIPAAEVAAAPVPAGSVPSNPPSVNSSFQQDDADLPAHL